LTEVAETIREQALAQAKKSLHPGDTELPRLLAALFLGRIQVCMASSIANVLASHDQNTQAIYTYDPVSTQTPNRRAIATI